MCFLSVLIMFFCCEFQSLEGAKLGGANLLGAIRT